MRWLPARRTPPIPAIVLTCDRYHVFTRHMIATYGAVWPSHPFEFHVPHQRRALDAPRVVARRAPEPIRATTLELLAPFHPEAWVYWCIDDKYLIRLVDAPVARIARAVSADRLRGVDGLLFCRCRRLFRPEHLQGEERHGPAGVTWLRRRDYSQIWIHQFLRVKVLRHLFEQLPETIAHAKAMDAMKDALPLPPEHRLYVVRDNLATFGESTTRGRVTRNCAASLRALGLGVPEGFAEAEHEEVMGVLGADAGAARDR